MPWPLRQVQDRDEYYRIRNAEGDKATIGLWWFHQHQDAHAAAGNGMQVSVILPPGGPAGLFMPYRVYPNDQRWTVAGEWPNVTVTPSINCPGYYHGWIQNGVITDDCEGRTF